MGAYTHTDDGWVEYRQVAWPYGPLDDRDPIRVGASPQKRQTDADLDEQARID